MARKKCRMSFPLLARMTPKTFLTIHATTPDRFLRGYPKRHCEEAQSADAAIQAISNVMRDLN
ncbi:hypothetical protein [Rickettsia endosymbiont of Aspidapion aeneum]|uniref:hypothetical protein n=1 Tax=Rickettsia endosymbiont of Aspidapion aeneum TaxID=3066247 RepID=UPI00313C75D4